MSDLLFGHDRAVVDWAMDRFKLNLVNGQWMMAVGILDEGTLVGAALFQEYNGHNVEVSYYGPNTMTLGIVKGLASAAVKALGVERITARTSIRNKKMTRGIKGVGFVYEGIQRKFYGNDDAVVYGLYGKNLARLSGQTVN